MLRLIAAAAIALTLADHWTTWLCLRTPISGWQIVEANPLAGWLFEMMGLLPGLALDTFVSLAAVAYVLTTHQFSVVSRQCFLAFVCIATGYAVVNNLQAISAVGLSPLGWS